MWTKGYQVNSKLLRIPCWESKNVIRVNIEISQNKQFQRLWGDRYKTNWQNSRKEDQAILWARETGEAAQERALKGASLHLSPKQMLIFVTVCGLFYIQMKTIIHVLPASASGIKQVCPVFNVISPTILEERTTIAPCESYLFLFSHRICLTLCLWHPTFSQDSVQVDYRTS